MRITEAGAGFVVALAITGCYAPSIRRCELACASSGEQCPSGLTCNTDNMCATSRNDLCTGAGSDGAIDGPFDAPTDVARDSACTWRATSNVDPCALNADLAMQDLVVNQTYTVDTSTSAFSASQITGEPIALVMLRDLVINPGGNVVVTGDRPLVILVARTARIDGTISYAGPRRTTTMFVPTCTGTGGAGSGGMGTVVGSGGGGGGLGTIGNNMSGANGGLVTAANFGAGGTVVGNGTGVPLSVGCDGGRGGGGGDPGHGGGAIQISAQTSLAVSGLIDVGGSGGGNGAGVAAGSGGGAGGTILLEGTTVNITNADLCANGGGGGGGNATATPIGENASCSTIVARGGGSGTARIGGSGAAGTTQATIGQAAGTAQMAGGGGGGGGPGWIRINGVRMGNPLVASPAFSSGM